MDKRANPFNELYVSETIGSSAFVEIFSPSILRNASALFLPGNVVLKGMQGSGKSMLLSLLKPEVRLAYAESSTPFPVAEKQARFIGAGINLTRSGAIDFGQRTIDPGKRESEILPVYFGDFLNYWIVFDILSTLELFRERADGLVAKELQLSMDDEKLTTFVKGLRSSRCWFGYLNHITTYADLRQQIADRISQYLAFLNFNSDDLPDNIRTTKTTVGEPVAQTVGALVAAGILPRDVHLFVRIDQYEELIRLEGKRKEYGSLFREIVNKALSLRDPNVSYRIGTRGYAWDEHPRVYGTVGNLERDRNFKLVDLDEILRRRENRKTWVFPEFAEDVFRKRLLFAQYRDVPDSDALEKVFGSGPSSEQRAVRYCGKASSRAIKIDKNWPQQWRTYLLQLAERDALSARLGEAWARQKGKGKVVNEEPSDPPIWNQYKTRYWRKERIQAALMQIAGRCAQRMIWAGAEDILELSGGNILVFVSLCQHIWSAWLRTIRSADLAESDNAIPKLDDMIQAVGIHEASTHWYNKLAEESGGTTRQRFVTLVATDLERKLYNDEALSYPGANGFSLEIAEIEAHSNLRDFLNECVDYGALVDAPHTTKETNRRPRRKWYLNPVLSPYFRLPHVRTKEPAYLSVKDVLAWLDASQSGVSRVAPQPHNVGREKQSSLFQEENS